MPKKTLSIQLTGQNYRELKRLSAIYQMSMNSLIQAGIEKEIAWRKIKAELDMPESMEIVLTGDPEKDKKAMVRADKEYREKFWAEIEKRIPIY